MVEVVEDFVCRYDSLQYDFALLDCGRDRWAELQAVDCGPPAEGGVRDNPRAVRKTSTHFYRFLFSLKAFSMHDKPTPRACIAIFSFFGAP